MIVYTSSNKLIVVSEDKFTRETINQEL